MYGLIIAFLFILLLVVLCKVNNVKFSINVIIDNLYKILSAPRRGYRAPLLFSIKFNLLRYKKYLFLLVPILILLYFIINKFRYISLIINKYSIIYLISFILMFILNFISSDTQSFAIAILFALPCLYMYCITIILDNFKIENNSKFYLIICSIILIIFSRNLYGIFKINNSTYKKMNNTIYKGICVENDIYTFLTDLQKDLYDVIGKNKNIIFEPIFTAGYLMAEGYPVTPDITEPMAVHYLTVPIHSEENYPLPSIIVDDYLMDYFDFIGKKPQYVVELNLFNVNFHENYKKFEWNVFLKENYNLIYKNENSIYNYYIYIINN